MELTRFQKIMLAALAGMFVLSGLLMIVFRIHPGVLFEGSLLKITEQDGRMVYSGRAHGTPVTVTVTFPTNFETGVDFTIGSDIHDICGVLYPVDRMETELGETVGTIRVTKNGETLFEGGYDPDSSSYATRWYDENGELAPFAGIDVRASSGGAGPWYGYETTVSQAVRFAFGPETSAHGHPAYFAIAALFSLALALDILFHKELFRLRHWAARDPEPTEEYLAFERAAWAVLAAVTAALYIIALWEIY